jgi:anaerobic dimethyl sulfoxide reductase subunit B (iron-sulfur subunit)
MVKQLGFYYDKTKCVRCLGCEVACKVTNKVEPGIKFRWISDIWSGNFPNVKRSYFSNSCLHCQNPTCMAACPTGAITKRAEDGIVVVNQEKCNGCRDCFKACPYGIPQFGKDGKMQKCDYCVSRGGDPACAQTCPGDAITYGDINDLLTKMKGSKQMDGKTKPSIIIKG